ncbi:MAG: FAD-binding oxidoreductase [Planctomycetes bacterium]|nr:FAD-binding oxidoreductase [Planctomycetota bacterium]
MSDALCAALLDALGERGVLTEASDRIRYEQGWRYGEGTARCIARPASTDEVAATLRLCAEHGARVVPQGANTGLVAASTPDGSGSMVVLSLERLNATIDVDVAARTALVDGGVLLSALNEKLAEHGLWFPVDLGADPQVGGMVATNTGGTRLLKYGDVRRNLLGVEVVLGDGRVLTQLNRLRKNNTGLDAKQLFVGTTGVFGVVTRAVLSVEPKPTQRATALVGCRDGAAVLSLLRAVEQDLGDVLSAFEVMGARAMDAVFRHQPNLRRPFDELPAYAVLVELSTTLPSAAIALDEVLEERLGAHLERAEDEIVDVLIGAADEFWQLRHHISESLRSDGRMVAFDVSVARSDLPAFTDRVHALLAERHPFVRLCDYGHWGDGGSHLNLLWRDEDCADGDALKAELQEAIYELAVREFGGSFSAEHGVGPHNQRFYDRYTDDLVKQLCRTIGTFCDPDDRLGTTRLH